MAEFDRIGDDLVLGIHLDQPVTAVRVEGWPNVEAILCAEVPGATGSWLGMDEDSTTHRSKGGLVEVKGAMEELPC